MPAQSLASPFSSASPPPPAFSSSPRAPSPTPPPPLAPSTPRPSSPASRPRWSPSTTAHARGSSSSRAPLLTCSTSSASAWRRTTSPASTACRNPARLPEPSLPLLPLSTSLRSISSIHKYSRKINTSHLRLIVNQ